MLINFIIYYFLISLFMGYLMKPDRNILACGLAGFYPKKGKKVNINKLYLLGILNEDRGTDSTGLSIGGDRFVGINANKKARDFISSSYKEIEGIDMINKSCILHTRKSTFGLLNDDNCHPFVYKSTDKTRYFSLAHNGGVTNTYDIKKQFLSDIEDVEKMLSIDSHYMALSLGRALSGKVSEHDILKMYKGNAALLYYNNDCFKVWKGANNNVEERPLYYIETPSGWYFSSIKMSLYLIFDRLYEVIEVKNNELLTFYNYKLEKSEIIERNHRETTYDYSTNGTYISKVNTQSSVYTHKKEDNSSKLFTGVPVAYPRFNVMLKKYTDINNDKLINGNYKCLSNPNIDSKEMYAVWDKGTENKFPVMFVDGVLVKDKYIYNTIKNRFVSKYTSVDKFFNSEKPRLKNILIDFIPLFIKNKLHTVIYKNNDGDLDYITMYDTNVETSILPKFGPHPINFKADGDSLTAEILTWRRN